MAEIPSQISFEHMLSHLFPGFFTSLTVFMMLDIISPINMTGLVLEDFNAMIAFLGFIILVGTILGVIIDGFHHKVIEMRYFSSLEKNIDIEQTPVKDNEAEKDKKIEHITAKNIADHVKSLMDCDETRGKCKKCLFSKKHKYDLLKLYYAFDIENMDKCIALHEYLKKSVYYYYEFYANTFIAMIPFTFVAPVYMVKILDINFDYAFLTGIILILLTVECLDFAWMAYGRWTSVLFYAFCRCLEGKTLFRDKEEHSIEIIWT